CCKAFFSKIEAPSSPLFASSNCAFLLIRISELLRRASKSAEVFELKSWLTSSLVTALSCQDAPCSSSSFHTRPQSFLPQPSIQSATKREPSGPKSKPVGNIPLNILLLSASSNPAPLGFNLKACMPAREGFPTNSTTKYVFFHLGDNAVPGLYTIPVGPLI